MPATSIDDYINGNIKIHEQTLTKRKKMFKDYLQTTAFNGTVLLTYKDNETINSIIQKKIEKMLNTNLLQRINHFINFGTLKIKKV